MEYLFFEELDSTNLYAKNNLDKLADRTIIHAASQNSGRGRMQRCWVDLGGENLFVSFVLKPSEQFKQVYSNLTQYLSVVLCKILEDYGLTPSIKWPNDVLIDGKKISGILSESVVCGNKFKGLVVGVGVNLNATKENFCLVDKEITSLNLEVGKDIDLKIFLNRLTDLFFKDYDKFLEQGFRMISKDYISRANFIGNQISVQVFNEKVSGYAKNINEDGELVISRNGNDIVLTMGDIL